MMINPSSRAKDYKSAYDYLKKKQSSNKIYFYLKDGSILSNIAEIVLMEDSSLLIFKMSTTQGIQYKIVMVEDIKSMSL